MAENDESPYDFAPRQEPPKRAVPVKPAAHDNVPAKVPGAPAVTRTSAPDGAAHPPEAALPRQECPYCGYEFLGKSRARCPECASPMDVGTRDYLQFSAPGWVGRLSLGAFLLGAGVVLHMVGIGYHLAQLMQNIPSYQHSKGIFHAAAALLILAGTILVSLREPGRKSSPGPGIAACLLALGALVFWAGLGGGALDRYELAAPTLKGLVYMALLCQIPLAMLLGFRLSGVAMQLPDDRLASHSKICGWLLAADGVIWLGLWAMELVTQTELEFFPISFPNLAILFLSMAWAAFTLLRLGLNLRVVARVGTEIATLRQQRLATRKFQAAGGS